MAVLQKIRGWGIWLSLIIAFALLLFLIDPSVMGRLFGNGVEEETYGVIAGEEVTNVDFYEMTKKYNFPDKEEGYNMAWQTIVFDRLMNPWFEKAGVAASDAQVDQMLSEYPEEYIAYLGGKEVLSNNLRNSLNVTRYSGLIYESAYPNSVYMQRVYDDVNLSATVNMVTVGASLEGIEVSDDEVRAAYNARKFGWAPRSSEVEYVNIHVYPSEADMAAATEKYNTAYAEFTETDNISAFLRRNSDENSKTVRFYKQGELREDVDAVVFGQGVNQTEIIAGDYDFVSARVLSSGMRSASGRVALYEFVDMDKADSLLGLLNTGRESIDTLRANHDVNFFGNFSIDINKPTVEITDQNGNPAYIDLGADFLETPVGKYAQKDRYGSRYVYALTEKAQPELHKEVAVFAKHVYPSRETYRTVSDSVKVFYANAKKVENLAEAGTRFSEMASIYDVTVLDTVTTYRTLEGQLGNMKSITKSVFKTKAGEVFFTENQNTNDLFLVGVKSIREEGPARFEEVKESLRQELMLRKAGKARLEQIRAEVKGESDFAAVAAKLGEEPVNHVIGYDDPRLVGAVRATEVGNIGMIDGLDGSVYVFEVVDSSVRNSMEQEGLRNSYWRGEAMRNGQGEAINYVLRLNDVTSYLNRIF